MAADYARWQLTRNAQPLDALLYFLPNNLYVYYGLWEAVDATAETAWPTNSAINANRS